MDKILLRVKGGEKSGIVVANYTSGMKQSLRPGKRSVVLAFFILLPALIWVLSIPDVVGSSRQVWYWKDGRSQTYWKKGVFTARADILGWSFITFAWKGGLHLQFRSDLNHLTRIPTGFARLDSGEIRLSIFDGTPTREIYSSVRGWHWFGFAIMSEHYAWGPDDHFCAIAFPLWVPMVIGVAILWRWERLKGRVKMECGVAVAAGGGGGVSGGEQYNEKEGIN
jgi:hypothetical protein